MDRGPGFAGRGGFPWPPAIQDGPVVLRYPSIGCGQQRGLDDGPPAKSRTGIQDLRSGTVAACLKGVRQALRELLHRDYQLVKQIKPILPGGDFCAGDR